MFRRDVGGSISLYWGRMGSRKLDYRDGSGVSKILVKHGLEALEGAIETIARAKKITHEGDRVVLEHNGRIAVLDRYRSLLFRYGEQHNSWTPTS